MSNKRKKQTKVIDGVKCVRYGDDEFWVKEAE
jgi:hypothetical protein